MGCGSSRDISAPGPRQQPAQHASGANSPAMRRWREQQMREAQVSVPATFDLPSHYASNRSAEPNPFAEANQRIIEGQSGPSAQSDSGSSKDSLGPPPAAAPFGGLPPAAPLDMDLPPYFTPFDWGPPSIGNPFEELNQQQATAGLSRSTSSESVLSFFGDRAGFLSPPDTLSTNIHQDFDGPIWHPETNSGPRFLIKAAAEKGFNLHLNVALGVRDPIQNIISEGFQEVDRQGTVVKFEHPVSNARLTLARTSALQRLPDWGEDVVFMGKNSAHTRHHSVHDGYEEAIEDRRAIAWQELGIQDIEAQSKAISTGDSDGRELTKVPPKSAVFSQRTQGESLREIFTKPSLDAAIDGGNFLSNGAERGERIYIVGLDSVAATANYHNHEIDSDGIDAAKKIIEEQLHLVGKDQLIFVEQPTFHIDMSMAFVGEKEIILNDSKRVHQHFTPNFGMSENTENTGILEDAVEATLEKQGVTVIRQPWGGGLKQYDFFNGEFVKSNDGEKTYFLTNGFFPKTSMLSRRHTDEVQKGQELQEQVTAFFASKGIEVVFSDTVTAEQSLSLHGGIGCTTNSLYS